MVDFGIPNIDLENLVKLDKESIIQAVVSGTVTYVGVGQIISNSTPAEVKDIIDDVVTERLSRPVSKMVGQGAVPDILGVGTLAYLKIGNTVADAVVKTEVVGETEVLTSGSESAAKITLAGIVGASQLINMSALGGN